jgi:ribosomal-protein-alanine N-acetyltransferase
VIRVGASRRPITRPTDDPRSRFANQRRPRRFAHPLRKVPNVTQTSTEAVAPDRAPELNAVPCGQELPAWTSRDALAAFLHEHLAPFQDTVPDIRRGIDDALGGRPGDGGFVLLLRLGERLAGALVLLRTGMKGYVPENLLLFVAVDAQLRGRGLGAQLVRAAVERCDGDVKLHVEYDNPAKRLYERLGFATKYAEMRFVKGGRP